MGRIYLEAKSKNYTKIESTKDTLFMIARKNRGCLGRLVRAFIGLVLAVVIVVVGIPLGINGYVCASARPSFSTVDSLSSQAASFDADAIVVLGAGINWDGSPSAVLKDRLDTAIELYNEGVASKIIMSGDNSQSSYNEVMAMALYAEDQGIPEDDVFCDHAGVSTYDSMYRLRYVFMVDRCVIVTQEYHLYRALYDVRSFGIEAYGVPSDRATYANMDDYEKREVLARVKDFFAVLLNYEAETKSEPVSLDQSGTVTQWW